MVLLLAGGPSTCAAGAGENTQRITGPHAIPARGRVTIPVININRAGEAPDTSTDLSFFDNTLDSLTFRNYWRTNSHGKYDPGTVVITQWVDPSSLENTINEADTRRKALIVVARVVLDAVMEKPGFEPAQLDATGGSFMPDGWTDGAIFIVPGIQGAVPVIPGKHGEGFFKKLNLGPFLAVGPGAGKEEILKGFSALLGLSEPGGECPVCLSLCAGKGGFPLLDAYSRMKAGWVDVLGLDGPPGTALILPSRTTGKVYRIGAGDEYFLIENRSAGDFTDTSIGEPGLAIYHVDENAAAHGSGFDPWRPRVMNESPDASFSVQKRDSCVLSAYLFREGDVLLPDYAEQNAISERHHPLNSNFYSGEPSDIIIENIDTRNHFPIVKAVVGYH